MAEDLPSRARVVVVGGAAPWARLSTKAAAKLSKAVGKELASLSMGNARVTVEVVQPEGKDGELALMAAYRAADEW